MTLNEIQSLVASVDANSGHYVSAHRASEAYTVWYETRLLDDMADDLHHGAIAFQIDRFTKAEHDEIAEALRAALDAEPRVFYSYLVDYERDTGYIHHIFDCEAM